MVPLADGPGVGHDRGGTGGGCAASVTPGQERLILAGLRPGATVQQAAAARRDRR